MKRNKRDIPTRGALETIEEAIHLLRQASVPRLATYYIGTLPFVLGFLYFWTDMSRSAFADAYCAQAAAGLSVLFLWMKCWQSVFAQGLMQQLCGGVQTRWTYGRVARLVKIQAVIQPWGLFLLPLALVVTIPFGWVYAFYQNGLVVGNDEDDLKTIWKKSFQQASLWPGQNHLLLSVVLLFGMVIFINLAFAVLFIPHVIHMLLGLDTVFTRTGIHMLNTTFFATVCGLTYLCIDPLIKAAYTLRCFYGESLTSGVDLTIGMRSLLEPRKVATAFVMMAVLSFGGPQGSDGAAFAEELDAPGAKKSTVVMAVNPTEMGRSIAQILTRREYRWRMPRSVDDSQNHLMRSFIGGVMDWLGGMIKPVWNLIVKFFKWLKSLLPDGASVGPDGEPSMFHWMKVTRALILFLLATVICALGIFLWRVWRRSKNRQDTRPEEQAVPVPDPTNEEVTADQLPSTEWANLARELVDQGELRLALRGLYLAGLAYLSEKEMIAIAKFKSDRDYERDLGRRVHVKPDLLQAFRQNLLVFERAWYGMHKFTREDFQACSANLERMKVCV